VPRLRVCAPATGTAAARVRWLLKPRASGGGHGIHHWHPGLPVPRDQVLQERIAGTPASILFAGDGRNCLPFALTRQLIGDRRFGAPPFRYCGNILPPPGDTTWGRPSSLWRTACGVAEEATRAFGLVGVNGVDLIVRRGRPVPIEVNPRYTAAMELAERRDGMSVFSAHVAGCTDHLSDVAVPATLPGASGKALVFARRPITVGDTRRWVDDPDIRDVPSPGSHIGLGSPICTVFAAAPTSAECYARLTQRADAIYATVEGSKR
jgi:predicted ATP-grasp superfamily ATP-dependent carboligase